MSGTQDPTGGAGADAYAAALDRLLDGLEPEAEGPAASAAAAQASADVDSITRALGLIGAALAGEGASAGGAGMTGAAGAALPVAESGATVVELSSWRRKLNPRVLSAAAVGLLVIGLGVPIALSTGGSDSDDSTTALEAPAGQLESADRADGLGESAPAPMAPGVEAYGTAPATAALESGAATGTSAADTTAAGGTANDAGVPAPSAAKAAAPTTGEAAGSAALDKAKRDAGPTFEDTVACARAILVGQITAVQPATTAGRVKVTLLVTDWIAPATGPALVTYEVGSPNAITPDGDEKLAVGQRRLFVFPAKPTARAWAYPDSPKTRDRIAAVRAERSEEGCQ